MPISRYHIRSEHGLSDPELQRAADKDDPEALLEAIAMAGLVGVLRQLGDLAQFAAEIFHDLHEEVMTTSARGHSLMSRVQQLEAEAPAFEKSFLSQTHHSLFFTNGGIDWHPNIRSEQNLVTRGDLPRFIMDSYEECRGPPRLFLLDKFDVAGAGACLKRYTDPSFFKVELASSGRATVKVHKEKRVRKVKKKGARPRNGEHAECVSSHAKLHQLLLEERLENACSDPERLVKLRKKQLNGSAVDAKIGISYMEKFLETSSPDHKMVCETSVTPQSLKSTAGDSGESVIEVCEISRITPVKRSLGNGSTCPSPNGQEFDPRPYSEMNEETNGYLVKVHEQISSGVADKRSSNHPKVADETELLVHEQKKRDCSFDGYHSDDATSEVDDYMDALATMDSELEIGNEYIQKRSILNIHSITDSNGKKEHQLQAPFSDSQSFADSSTSEEINAFNQETNQEHTEVQAQLSDSQLTRSSCASDHSSSFRTDRNEEHTQLQAHSSDSQSIGNSSTSEIEDMPSNQLPQSVELEKTCDDEFVNHDDDAHVQGEEILDSRPVSSRSSLMDSVHLLFSSDLGPSSPMLVPRGAKSGETHFSPVEPHLRLKDDEHGKSLVESFTSVPDSLSLVKDNSCPVVSYGNNSLNNMDVCDPCVHSVAQSQVSNDLNFAHEDEYDDHCKIKVLQAESPNEYASELMVNGDIGSLGEDPIGLSMDVGLNSSTKQLRDGQDLKLEADVIATQHKSEDSSPIGEAQPVNCFAEELFSDQQSEFEEVPRMTQDDEISGLTCSVDPLEDDHQVNDPSSPNYIRHDNDVIVTDDSTKVQSEEQAVSALPLVDSAENDASIVSSPSRNLPDLNEPSLGSLGSHLMEIESNEAELSKSFIDLNAEKRENQLEPSSDIIYSPMCTLTKSRKSFTTFVDPYEKKVNVALARESLLKFAARNVADQPEIASADVLSNLNRLVPCDSSDSETCLNIHDSSMKEIIQQGVVDHLEIAPADVRLSLNRSVPCDPSNSEICNEIQDSSFKENTQYGSFVRDVNMVPICSEVNSQKSESILFHKDQQNNKDGLSSPYSNQLKPETHSELFLKSHFGQQDAGSLLRNEENYSSKKFQSQQIQISNQLEQERFSHAASEYDSEVHPDESLSFDSPSKLSLHDINPTKHAMDQLKPILPDLFPQETNVNLEEMPPMPPLPPKQWTMGKVQHASQVSQREEIGVSQALFQPIQPIEPNEKSQVGLSSSERDTSLYQNPFLPVMAVESNMPQHSSGFSAVVSDHPVAIPLQFPIMVNEANGQYNYLVLERSQIQNPFLALPPVSTGMPANGYVASEGEIVQSSSPCTQILPAECAVSGADPIFPQEKLTQSPSQLSIETSLEVKDGPGELHLVLPAECVVSGADPIFPQEKLTQSPSQLTVETSFEAKDGPGELHLVLPAECAVSGEDSISPKENPSQLMEEISLEVKTLEQSSINLDREQGYPYISPVSQASIEIGEPNHSQQPSDGKMALSKDISSQPLEFDSDTPNGKPNNKFPHPQSPLVDGLAALDKSKLRKVSERVIAPKVDERDSFLEQIRTKSFNLRPAVAKRPALQGPKTNLKIAAILEKANSIRQALAGSDEDDDTDSWSDS